MTTRLREKDVADATLKILQESDLKELTVRKVMNLLADQFGIDASAFTQWKRFVRSQIETYLSSIEYAEPAAEHSDAKERRPPLKPAKLKGLMKAVVLAEPLAELLGEVVLPRTHIAKRISEYVKKNGLQNPADKREILCDEKLRKAFEVDKFTFFSLNKLISNLVYKPQDCSSELQELAAKCEQKLLEEMAQQAQKDYANGIDPAEKKKSRKRKRVQHDEDGNPAPKKLNGLSKPMQLDAALAAVCGESVLSRSNVVKRIWEYIKSNNLQDPHDKRKIMCDEKLKNIFNGEERITGFGLSKYLSSHLSEYTGEVDDTGRPVLPAQ